MNSNKEISQLWCLDDPEKIKMMGQDILSGKIPYDENIVSSLLINKHLPFWMAEKLASPGYQADLYRRASATPEALHALAQTADHPATVEIIAEHANTAPATVIKLSQPPNPQAVYFVIKSGRLPACVVEGFASSKSGDVRKAVGRVSKNPKTLRKLALDREAKVRLAVALNAHADDATIRMLARNEKRPCVTLCRCLARRLKDPVLLAKIIEDCPDMNKAMVRAFHRNVHCPAGLKVFVLLRAQTS